MKQTVFVRADSVSRGGPCDVASVPAVRADGSPCVIGCVWGEHEPADAEWFEVFDGDVDEALAIGGYTRLFVDARPDGV